jgi:hypothetical protein
MRPSGFLGTGSCCGSMQICQGVGSPPVGPCGEARCGDVDYVSPASTEAYKSAILGGGGTIKPAFAFLGGLTLPTFCNPIPLGTCQNSLYACGGGIEFNRESRWDAPIDEQTCIGTVSRPVTGRVPPEECTYANYGGAVWASGAHGANGRISAPPMPMADCDGRCFGCESNNGPIDGKGRPKFCNLLRPVPGGGICESDETTRFAQMQALAQAAGNPNGTSERCEPPNDKGVRECTKCEAGACSTTIRVDAITADQQISKPCLVNPGLPGCDVAQSIASAGEPWASVEWAGPAPSIGTGRSYRQPINKTGIAQSVDGADSPTSAIPQQTPAQNKNPKNDGQVNDPFPADSNSEPSEKFAQDKPEVGADPIALMSGSLEVDHTDLSFAGPVRPLQFTRVYSSQGHDRSELGSNWSHNWDVRVIPLRFENLPDGVDPFCAGTPHEVTCAMIRVGNNAKLYMRDRRDGLFKPQAGSFSTLMKTDFGWSLRSPDWHVQQFDADGYLEVDHDRFGNGFQLEYELNAWGRVDEALCPNATFRLKGTNGAYVDAQGPLYMASSLPCTLLSGLVGRTKPMVKSPLTPLTVADVNLPPNPSQALQDARALLIASQSGGIGNASTWGQRKKRVKRVKELSEDGLSVVRSLDFSYFPDTDTTVLSGSTVRRAGLLQSVTGPQGGKVEFTYTAPALPARLSEALLSEVVRSDTAGQQTAGVQAGPTRTYSFTYAAAATPGTTMTTAQVADLRDRFKKYFDTTYNCSYIRMDQCGNPLFTGFMAHSDEELNRRVDAYLSDEADNLRNLST